MLDDVKAVKKHSIFSLLLSYYRWIPAIVVVRERWSVTAGPLAGIVWKLKVASVTILRNYDEEVDLEREQKLLFTYLLRSIFQENIQRPSPNWSSTILHTPANSATRSPVANGTLIYWRPEAILNSARILFQARIELETLPQAKRSKNIKDLLRLMAVKTSYFHTGLDRSHYMRTKSI